MVSRIFYSLMVILRESSTTWILTSFVTLYLTFAIYSGNPWSDVITSIGPMLTWRVVLGGATVGVMIYALYKLIMFVKYQGSHFNVPQVCLALEIIANICKLNFVWRLGWSLTQIRGLFFSLKIFLCAHNNVHKDILRSATTKSYSLQGESFYSSLIRSGVINKCRRFSLYLLM